MNMSRRRFLTIASAACLAAPSVHAHRWQGVALGARAQIVLDHPRAPEIVGMAVSEIDRLEDIFSLYRPASSLCRLNADGRLTAPPFEMLECLATARQVHRATEGRFDPTVQPLWTLLAAALVDTRQPDPAALEAARRAIGFDRVRFSTAAVTLEPGQALTLNGIAQGYVADSVARLLQDAGVTDVLIDTGEILALGGREPGGGWPVTIAGEARTRHLTGRALATSASLGAMPGPSGHILDPRGTTQQPALRQVSVSAPSAALADALSTGLCLAESAAAAHRIAARFPGVRLESIHI